MLRAAALNPPTEIGDIYGDTCMKDSGGVVTKPWHR